ncbi:hypothetical protein [Terrisporobacter petrolearius]|nr:hypothetical protein [Terrisporobacter petrolearius]
MLQLDYTRGISSFNNNIIKPINMSKLESSISKANLLYNDSIEGINVDK